ncbi:MAG: methyltransferase family protein [Candidatus Brocadiaceae bacterium]|nr:methyltransferase family protein [Candidatus Brocadiaceae bacterium]
MKFLNKSIYKTFEYLFDELAEYYQFLYPNIGELNFNIAKELDSKILKPIKARKILDCTCGIGLLAIELSKLGYEVAGSDISNRMLENAVDNANKAGTKVKFVHSNILNLSKNIEEKFDVVICKGNSFSNINPEAFEEALENISSVLNKNGICYIDIRNHEEVIKQKPLFEHRSHVRLNSKDVVCFYIFDYKENLRTYNTFFVFYDRKTNTISHKLISIDGFFVFKKDLIRAFEKAGFKDIKKIKFDSESKDVDIYVGKKI